jgi:hypothetical protein
VRFRLSDPPEGASLKEILLGQNGTDIALQADTAKAKPGLKGDLWVLYRPYPSKSWGIPAGHRQLTNCAVQGKKGRLESSVFAGFSDKTRFWLRPYQSGQYVSFRYVPSTSMTRSGKGIPR